LLVFGGYEHCWLLVGFHAAVVFPDAGKSATRNSCTSSSTGSAAKTEEARNSASLGPFAMGGPFTSLEAVARSVVDRQTGNSIGVAPKRIPFVLALEE
jgi:hypothetical protein